MFSRLLTLAILVAAGYWYWSGPYQRQQNPDSQQLLQERIELMRECIRGQNYKAGATGINQGDPEQICAEKFKLYHYEGEWYSSE